MVLRRSIDIIFMLDPTPLSIYYQPLINMKVERGRAEEINKDMHIHMLCSISHNGNSFQRIGSILSPFYPLRKENCSRICAQMMYGGFQNDGRRVGIAMGKDTITGILR